MSGTLICKTVIQIIFKANQNCSQCVSLLAFINCTDFINFQINLNMYLYKMFQMLKIHRPIRQFNWHVRSIGIQNSSTLIWSIIISWPQIVFTFLCVPLYMHCSRRHTSKNVYCRFSGFCFPAIRWASVSGRWWITEKFANKRGFFVFLCNYNENEFRNK